MILAIALALAQAAVTPELRQHVEAGLKAKNTGDWDTAIREFHRVTELAPDLAASHVNLGNAYLLKGDHASAIAPLRRALELNPDLPGAHQMLGTSLLAAGAAPAAIPHLEKAGVEDLLGIAFYESGRTRDALDKLEAALVKRPGDPDLTYYLSQAHGVLAKQLFDQLRANPNASARAQQMLGDAAAAAGNRPQAEKHFRGALAARPGLRGVHLAIGELHLANADYAKAAVEFAAETKLAPSSAIAAYKLGAALLQLGRSAESAKELQRAYALQPDMPETSLELGKALAATGDLPGAATALARVTTAEPDSQLAEAAHLQLAQVYRRMGRSADADRETKALAALRARRRR